jgi:protein-tyrosine phosphatase
MRILFVCSGNTCRSPFAEGAARRAQLGLKSASAGSTAVDGAPCPPEALAAAAALGVDLAAHRARRLERADVEAADVVVAMDVHHADAARALGGGGKTRLLAATPILDPFGGDEAEYRRRYEEIATAVESLLAELKASGPPLSSPPWVGKEVHPPPAASVPPNA